MLVTNYLINKLKDAGDTLKYKGENYVMLEYGGEGRNCYVYYESKDSKKMIKMEYTLHKVKDNHYKGIDKVKTVTIWEDYWNGLVLDEWINY